MNYVNKRYKETAQLMRINKQAQATGILKEYIILLSDYEGQGIEGAEKEWTDKEIGWANRTLDRISRIYRE